MGEVVTMARWELDRLHVIRKVLERRLSWSQAAQLLGLKRRQVGRLCARVRQEGDRGIVHKLRGRPGNRRLPAELLEKALSALHDPLWEGFWPRFGGEKLDELHGIELGAETVRKLMISTGLWLPRRERALHRKWRPRRPCVGMLVQLDGSHHDWFEGRGPKCVLLLFIDDATSQIMYAELVDSEDTLNVMRATQAYIERYGRPGEVYVDRDSIFKTNRQANVEEDLREGQPATQYKRALDELGIELIWAYSPQAKGRVERSFRTHQRRLVLELRLLGISTFKEANEYLWGTYIPAHNARYAVQPEISTDAHRPVPEGQNLAAILAICEERTVFNDLTARFKNRWLQIAPSDDNPIRPGAKITIETRVDGSTHLRYRGGYLSFGSLEKRPYRPLAPKNKGSYPTTADVLRLRKERPRNSWLGLGKDFKRGTKHYDPLPPEPVSAPAFL